MPIDDPPEDLFIRLRNHIFDEFQRSFHTLSQSHMEPQHTENTHSNNNGHPLPLRRSFTVGNDEAFDVFNWATTSRYSPLNLQSLPQPRPNDAPDNCPDIFIFRDAFEDLLAVSAGEPLSDLRQLAFEKRLELIEHYLYGIPIEHWIVKVGQRDLWGAYFNLSSHARRSLAQGMTPWRLMQITSTFHPPSMFQAPVSSPAWEAHEKWRRIWTNAADEPPRHEEEAGTEADLYEANKSEFATDSGAKIVAAPQRGTSTNVTGKEESSTETIETTDGGKILKVIQQRSFDNGTEQKTAIKRFDAKGDLVNQSEKVVRIWSTRHPEYNSQSRTEQSSPDTKGTVSAADRVDTHSSEQKGWKFLDWLWK
ncbi:uncharacterized protein F4822DRAFT_4815 [Hypoxylon trugodes]|uniref:uncharacterized protein n=1 Tax=Hypoxylon trugodes TaxID=326681 RepID=UPI00218CB8D8|nr:uncharacterized protein F4822DRAFT_4815 [Hypoxylon trugodes]KAI1393231.1 hypothetical protein F4822DRAFT_4815 [Hypoxylon trugodes]